MRAHGASSSIAAGSARPRCGARAHSAHHPRRDDRGLRHPTYPSPAPATA